MSQNRTIIFVCEHGAAKSVVAASYFNQLAVERNMDVRAIARGANPDSELSPTAWAGLQRDGLTPPEPVPRKLSPADIDSAGQIVTFCELPGAHQGKANVERWDDVPPVSEDYEKARDAILEKINRLIDFIA
jgi:protein-tyrosine-phosphatase